ncbi:hypothetical protein EV182_003105 [Spiromyces aspiralis]|uniref:Uncharacterized protein n=1 Tax=Spiromyces aspiralis TaxID=68401 RepID=A0ACC1HU84_9FUNG|nr:hypothetical protein EV182_003105 [Spiromyces aspiralis]
MRATAIQLLVALHGLLLQLPLASSAPNTLGEGALPQQDPVIEFGKCGPEMACPEGQCCSGWGFCGTDETFCGVGCQSGSCWQEPTDFPPNHCDANHKCPTGFCCSPHGYCGKGPEYCGESIQPDIAESGQPKNAESNLADGAKGGLLKSAKSNWSNSAKDDQLSIAKVNKAGGTSYYFFVLPVGGN